MAATSSHETANVFFVHSPFQLLMADHMVQHMVDFDNAVNVLLLDMTPPEGLTERSRWSRWHQVEPPVGGRVRGKAKQGRRALREIDELLAEYKSVRLFLANLMWPLKNALFARVRNRANVAVCNYPEGVGSLCLTELGAKQKLLNRVKQVQGWFGGFPYHPVPGDMMGIAAASRVYTLDPVLLRPHTEAQCVRIPALPMKAASEFADECVFLGQVYADWMAPDEFAAMCRQTLEHVLSLGAARNWYKPHHAAKLRTEEAMFLKAGFELVADRRPAELLFQQLPVKYVASFNSSALVHFKMMYGDQVRCVACFAEKTLGMAPLKYRPGLTMHDIFARYGVEEWPAADEQSS